MQLTFYFVILIRFDVRNTTLEQGEHWSDNMLLGGRGSFSYKDEPPKLILKDLKESDAGIYQCRVDYKINPTKHFKVNLTVIGMSLFIISIYKI